MNNVLLILRSELVCLAILVFILIYNIIYRKEENKRFAEICILAILNVLVDGATVVIVNNLELFHPTVNMIIHWFMYTFSIWFACVYLSYIFSVLLSLNKYKKIRPFLYIPIVAYISILPFLDVEYLQGNGTYYSMGSATKVAYGIAFFYLISTFIYILLTIKKAEKIVLTSLLPVTAFAVVLLVSQMIVPEFLFTGAVITMVTLAVFFAIENPAAHYMKRAYIDLDTGVKNRNCYDEEIKKFNKIYFKKNKESNIGCIVCDLNGLKKVNDTLGHIVGDEMIRKSAQVISSSFKSATAVYRIGGDEFVAVYEGDFVANMAKETEQLKITCEKQNNYRFPLSIAAGFADKKECEAQNFLQMVTVADKRMYENKQIMKSQMK